VPVLGQFRPQCRIVEGRQRAERCRTAGNDAFKQKQWSEAYRCYEEGLEAERANAKLQGNAAMAALKMGCFAQAIEHCDKVIRLHEFLLDKPEDPLVVKTLQRRATARAALGHYKEAVDVRVSYLVSMIASQLLRLQYLDPIREAAYA
jgi:tetratricopeptide (TPR) repeat protein